MNNLLSIKRKQRKAAPCRKSDAIQALEDLAMAGASWQKAITPRQVHSRMYHLTPRTFKDNKDNLSPFTDNFPGG